MTVNLDDYNDVASRILEFRAKHPQGSLQPANPAKPYEIITVGDQTIVIVTMAAYRTADDPRPGIASAQEVFPGRTAFTRGSEIQNAETSAVGRAIVFALAADTRRGIASADEVRNHQAEQSQSNGNGHAPSHNGNGSADRITGPQIKRLQTLFTKADIRDRDDKLRFCSEVVGRELASSKDMTWLEAVQVMDAISEGLVEDKTEIPA